MQDNRFDHGFAGKVRIGFQRYLQIQIKVEHDSSIGGFTVFAAGGTVTLDHPQCPTTAFHENRPEIRRQLLPNLPITLDIVPNDKKSENAKWCCFYFVLNRDSTK